MTEDRKDEGRMPDGQRVPLPLKLFGALCVLGGLASLGDLVPVAGSFVQGLGGDGYRTASVVIFAALMAVLAASAVLFVFLGVRLLRNRRKHAAATANTLAALTVLSIIGTLMLFGLSAHHIGYLVQLVILIALTSYLDPSLAEERALQRKLRKMDKEQRREERRRAAEAKPKRGFITLNFFNLFWIFVVCCVLGAHHRGAVPLRAVPRVPGSRRHAVRAVLAHLRLRRAAHDHRPQPLPRQARVGDLPRERRHRRGVRVLTSWIMEFSFSIRAGTTRARSCPSTGARTSCSW